MRTETFYGNVELEQLATLLQAYLSTESEDHCLLVNMRQATVRASEREVQALARRTRSGSRDWLQSAPLAGMCPLPPVYCHWQ